MKIISQYASLKGTRSSNEDSHNIYNCNDQKNTGECPINFFAVYDGHGGKFVSNFLSEYLYHFFIDKRVKYPLSKDYVNKVFTAFQELLFEKYSDKSTDCGSTALIVCHYKNNDKNYLNVINLGDSRCVLCRNNIGVPLTLDHKPMAPLEKTRIESMGGKITKTGDTHRIVNLSVSRSFGDKDCSPYVSHVPDIYNYKIDNNDKFIIIACDGLWDVMTSQEAVNFVIDNCYDKNGNRLPDPILKEDNSNKKEFISYKIAEHAIKLKCEDNVTCIIVFFDK
jgi:serine/threonine protein phosphatase PrpC